MLTYAALIPIISWICLNFATGILLLVPFPYRWFCIPAILVPATISLRTIQYLSFPPGLSELWGTITLIGLMHFSSLLYIKKWSLRHPQQSNKALRSSGNWYKRELWTRIYKVASNPRFVRVSYKDVVLPKRASGVISPVKSLAIHRRFTRRKIPWLLIKIGIYTSLGRLATSKIFSTLSIDDFTPAKANLLRRFLSSSNHGSTDPVSTREIMIRTWFTANSIYAPILLLDCIHTILAVFFIYVLRVDIPEDWPDLFGSPLEAFTLGRFWSRFWHRVHLSGYSDYANLLIDRLPHSVTRNRMARRTFMTFLLFFISGLVHHFTSLQLNPECSGDYADVQFFCMNAVAVISESALLQLGFLGQSSKADRSHSMVRSHVPRLPWMVSARLVGYLWVVGFFVWAVPNFYYPRVYCTINQQIQRKKTML